MLSATSVKKDVVAIKPLATTAPPPTENPEGTQDGNRMSTIKPSPGVLYSVGKGYEGKEYIKAVYCHPAYLTFMQSTP